MASPRRRGPARSIFMITVVDQHRPWLMPSRTLAAITQPQFGAQMISSGTGRPASQPATSALTPTSRLNWPRLARSPSRRAAGSVVGIGPPGYDRPEPAILQRVVEH